MFCLYVMFLFWCTKTPAHFGVNIHLASCNSIEWFAIPNSLSFLPQQLEQKNRKVNTYCTAVLIIATTVQNTPIYTAIHRYAFFKRSAQIINAFTIYSFTNNAHRCITLTTWDRVLHLQHIHHGWQEEPSTAIADRCTRSRINSAIFVSSEGRGFDSIEFLRRHGSQSVLCRKARSAENITDEDRKVMFGTNRINLIFFLNPPTSYLWPVSSKSLIN